MACNILEDSTLVVYLLAKFSSSLNSTSVFICGGSLLVTYFVNGSLIIEFQCRPILFKFLVFFIDFNMCWSLMYDSDLYMCRYTVVNYVRCHRISWIDTLSFGQPIKRKKEGEEKRMTQEEMLLEAAQTGISCSKIYNKIGTW